MWAKGKPNDRERERERREWYREREVLRQKWYRMGVKWGASFLSCMHVCVCARPFRYFFSHSDDCQIKIKIHPFIYDIRSARCGNCVQTGRLNVWIIINVCLHVSHFIWGQRHGVCVILLCRTHRFFVCLFACLYVCCRRIWFFRNSIRIESCRIYEINVSQLKFTSAI